MDIETHSEREDRIGLFKEVCKEQGIKVTPQRLEIFLEIVKAEDHPSAEDVYERVRERLPTVSLDTVYRTLTTFDRLGIVAKVQFPEDKTRFDPNMKTHHHAICTECKRVVDFYWAHFDKAELPSDVAGWGTVQSKLVQIRGICAECARKSAAK